MKCGIMGMLLSSWEIGMGLLLFQTIILWFKRESQRTDVLNSAVDKTVFNQKSMWGYTFTPRIGAFAVLYLGSQPILKVASVNAKV